jgi:GMP synthase-like glutamine amidotransferase
MQRLLVFQHLDIEHPGVFRDFLARDGVAVHTVELDAGEAIPPLDDFDALWVMGGPMDVWDEPALPWLRDEKAAIREAVLTRSMPYLGLCLGHQLLAEACGGEVGLMAEPEVGVFDIELTAAAASDALFANVAAGPCFQWHSAGVTQLPPGAVSLATSPRCPVQALRVGRHAWGLQYHVEISATTVAEWASVPAYREALEKSLGEAALTRVEADALRLLPQLNEAAGLLYAAFVQQVRLSRC